MKKIVILVAVLVFVVMSVVGCTMTDLKVGNVTTDKVKVAE
jgi:hypothetical protein